MSNESKDPTRPTAPATKVALPNPYLPPLTSTEASELAMFNVGQLIQGKRLSRMDWPEVRARVESHLRSIGLSLDEVPHA